MRSALRAAIGLTTLAMGSFASADGFSLKRLPQVGSAIKYTMSVDFLANNEKGKISATLLEQVTDVDKAGNFSVQQTQIDARGVYSNEEFDIPPRTPITMTYAPNRMISAIKGDLIDANSYRVEHMATIIDPGKPVNIGDEWVGDIAANKTLGTPSVKLQYRLLGEEKVAETDTLKIQGKAKEIEGVSPAVHTFTIWISKSDGAMIRLDSVWENAPFPGTASPVHATISIVKAAS